MSRPKSIVLTLIVIISILTLVLISTLFNGMSGWKAGVAGLSLVADGAALTILVLFLRKIKNSPAGRKR